MRPLFRHILTVVLFLGGIALLIGLAREIGLDEVRARAGALVWTVPLGVLVYALSHAANTLGWRYALGANASKVPFPLLFAAWASGDLVNWGTPGALGGEVLRAHLIRHKVPMDVGIASVTIGRLTQTTGQFTFIAAVLALTWTRLEMTPGQKLFLVVIVGGAVVFLTGLYLLQRTKTFSHVVTAARKVGLRGRLLDRIETALREIDAHVSGYHRELPGDFRRSIFWFFVGWAVATLEVPVILVALQAHIVDWRAVLAIEALAVLVEAMAFLVPGKVGVDEGGRVIVFKALGYTGAQGFGYSMFRRARELVWFSICFVLVFVVKRKVERALAAQAPPPPPQEQGIAPAPRGG